MVLRPECQKMFQIWSEWMFGQKITKTSLKINFDQNFNFDSYCSFWPAMLGLWYCHPKVFISILLLLPLKLFRILVNEDINIFTTDSVYPSVVKGFKICNNEVGCLWFLKILIIWEWIDWGLRAVGFIRTLNYGEDINMNKIENGIIYHTSVLWPLYPEVW